MSRADDKHTSVFLHPIERIFDEGHVMGLAFCGRGRDRAAIGQSGRMLVWSTIIRPAVAPYCRSLERERAGVPLVSEELW